MNCWEQFQCEVRLSCPAYPDHGTHCARVAGTLCQGKEQVMMATKIEGCNNCYFYQSTHYDKSFKGFVRLDPNAISIIEKKKVYEERSAAIDAEVERLMDTYKQGSIDKASLAEQIAQLSKEQNAIANFLVRSESSTSTCK
jgi:hypothetical protein